MATDFSLRLPLQGTRCRETRPRAITRYSSRSTLAASVTEDESFNVDLRTRSWLATESLKSPRRSRRNSLSRRPTTPLRALTIDRRPLSWLNPANGCHSPFEAAFEVDDRPPVPPLPQLPFNHIQKLQSMSSVSSGEEAKVIAAPYSIFTRKQKIFIAIIASLSTLLPYFASNIFYPVIDLIATDLDVSVNKVNLTITAYLLFQGLAPSFVGNLSDCYGRRPALIIAFSVFIAGCLGAAFTDSYKMLVITRCLQSAGSSGTVAIASAMVTDIVTSAQRGTYYSYVQLGGMLGFSLGPVIGGLLSHVWGWRSIFWFLTAFASFVFLVIVFFLPETCRNIVDNGSTPAQTWNKPLVNPINGTPKTLQTIHLNPLASFTLFLRWESCIVLLYAGLLNSTQFYVFTTLPVQFTKFYNFTTVNISLVYLATGVGTAIAVLISGRMQDYNFRRHANQLGIEISNEKQQSLTKFPIEVSRLQTSFPPLIVSLVSLIAYGWLLQTSPAAAPIAFAFLWAAGNNAAFTSFSNLVVDLNRDRPGSATASINVARCWSGAGVVAFANPLTELIGIGRASTVVAGYLVVLFPLILLVYYRGQAYRERKEAENESDSTAV